MDNTMSDTTPVLPTNTPTSTHLPIDLWTLPTFDKLTPSQEAAVESCVKLIPVFKILVIKGDSGSGKYTVAKEVFKRLNAIVEPFDLCELARSTSQEVSNQHVVEYLNSLLHNLEQRTRAQSPGDVLRNTTKRSRSNLDKDVSNLTIHSSDPQPSSHKRYKKSTDMIEPLQNSTYKPRNLGIIYMRHYNRIADVLTDCYAKVRYLLPLILKSFTDKMPPEVRIVITTHGCMLPEGLHWCVDLNTTRQDMEHVVKPYLDHNYISPYEQDSILKMSKTVPIGRILYCLRYALAMNGTSERKEPRSEALVTDPEPNLFVEAYKKALGRFSGSTVDIDKDVPKPVPEDDLVGVEEIIDEIATSIINPMKLSIPGIPIKKGLLLCGPPGTGKTSIGRWLAHQIKGKFYSIGGEATINGSSLVDTFDQTVRRARDNAPAVIFIDDGDVLFDHDDTYRAFLTILDGIETNKRNDVCIILTCMNLRNVPSSLLRGGRLEMTLITRLPDRKKIQTILQRSLNRMCQTLVGYNVEIALKISNQITPNFISDLSVKMSGWNCADIHRCVNDVTRLIVAKKGTHISELFEKCIRQIRQQYTLCGKCESTNLDDRPYDTYVT